MVNYLDSRPFSVSLGLEVVVYNGTQTLAQPIAFTGDRSFKDRAPDLLPTSVLEHHPLNGMLADFPTGLHPLQYIPLRFKSILTLTKGRDARRFGVDLGINRGDYLSFLMLYLLAPRRGTGPPRRVPPVYVICIRGVVSVLGRSSQFGVDRPAHIAQQTSSAASAGQWPRACPAHRVVRMSWRCASHLGVVVMYLMLRPGV